ncbi:MAG: hypothetical protein WC889_20170, partial [Myxococcota bacterium]
HFTSCAGCTEFTDPNDCRKFNNLIGKVMGVVLNSDRRSCILKIRELGPDAFAAYMAGEKKVSIPRR